MKESGWTKEGRKKWVAWKKMSEVARASPAGQELETKFLKKWREENGIVGDDPDDERAKKRKAQRQLAASAADEESDVDMDYD